MNCAINRNKCEAIRVSQLPSDFQRILQSRNVYTSCHLWWCNLCLNLSNYKYIPCSFTLRIIIISGKLNAVWINKSYYYSGWWRSGLEEDPGLRIESFANNKCTWCFYTFQTNLFLRQFILLYVIKWEIIIGIEYRSYVMGNASQKPRKRTASRTVVSNLIN
jgi:hypothetical protein